MPELPEVETVRLYLSSNLVGLTITSLEVLTDKSFDGEEWDVVGQQFIDFKRQGKQLSAYLSNGQILLFHLKMTGQIIHLNSTRSVFGHPTSDMDTSPLPNKSTRVIFYLSDHSTLYFNDQRKFGWIKVFSPDTLSEFQSGLGIDILDDEFTLEYFTHTLLASTRPIKTVLLDQSRFAGIGNIYANDALFEAKIHPQTQSHTLTSPKINRLYRSIINLLQESITHGGSTAKDKKYLRPDGTFGSHQYHFRVYQRTGEPCLVCSTPIAYIKLGGRGTFFCPHCQK